jgi:hypothetical protein
VNIRRAAPGDVEAIERSVANPVLVPDHEQWRRLSATG